MSTEDLLKLADLAEAAERCEHCGGPLRTDEDEQAELAAMASADKAADPDWRES